MAKKKGEYDLDGILGTVQALYPKDKKSQAMLTMGDSVREDYRPEDGVPLPPDSIITELTGLPCAPFNKILQFAGNPDTGKSTTVTQTMAAALAHNFIVVLWDAEDKFDASRFRKGFKSDPARLIIIKTNEILQGGEKVRKIVNATKAKYPSAPILIAWDSVGGSQSRSHSERELDNEKNAQPGQDAKENSSVMKMFVALINKYPDSIAILLANQVYAKIGFMQMGDKECGGKKVEFHSSLIVIFKRLTILKQKVGNKMMKWGIVTRATVNKNHLTPGEMSVHELDFQITADGAKALTEPFNFKKQPKKANLKATDMVALTDDEDPADDESPLVADEEESEE